MCERKGIILAGGTGSRLFPTTVAVNKHLLPVYDKPMIYLPLSVLMISGIREILIITNEETVPSFTQLLGNGEFLGIDIQYAIQDQPNGLPEAYIIAEKFLDGAASTLILGDNIFYGYGLTVLLQKISKSHNGAHIFASEVSNPERFGVVELSEGGVPVSLLEKPEKTSSNWAVTGLYMLDNSATERAKTLRPSARGETEIVDLLNTYLIQGSMNVVQLPRGYTWLDMGTPDDLLNASEYFRVLYKRQKTKIAVVEEVAWRNKWIDASQLRKSIELHKNSEYGEYLLYILNKAQHAR